MTQEKINIVGMSCGHCQSKVEAAIKDVDGVQNVTVKLNEKQATVDFNPDITNLTKINKAIKDAGYDTK